MSVHTYCNKVKEQNKKQTKKKAHIYCQTMDKHPVHWKTNATKQTQTCTVDKLWSLHLMQ